MLFYMFAKPTVSHITAAAGTSAYNISRVAVCGCCSVTFGLDLLVVLSAVCNLVLKSIE